MEELFEWLICGFIDVLEYIWCGAFIILKIFIIITLFLFLPVYLFTIKQWIAGTAWIIIEICLFIGWGTSK